MRLGRDSYLISIDILHQFFRLKFDSGRPLQVILTTMWQSVTSECPREYVTLILTFACWTRTASNLTPENCVKRIFRLPQCIFELSQKLVPCKLYPADFPLSPITDFFVSGLILAHYWMFFLSNLFYILKGRTCRLKFRYLRRRSNENW
jgi:hypothetical protein